MTRLEATFEARSLPDADSEVLVRVENVSKKFCRSLKRSLWYGLQDAATELTGCKPDHPLRSKEFWAVRNISFELQRGECLGLIGRNGAGKSTLLKMLNGLIKPDKGRIEIYGNVGGLIALGAGFNPILSGRENVYINGSILGLPKAQIDAHFDEIIDFSELGEFIDSPVQSYSSGMAVRLGFAVAVILIKPDVLLLDEVLAVGDIGFTVKCLNIMRSIASNSAVIFVSHDMQFVSTFCSRVLVMEKGRELINTATKSEAIDKYFSLFPVKESVSGTGEANVYSATLKNLTTGETGTHHFPINHSTELEIEFELSTQKYSHVRIQIDTQGFVPVQASTIYVKPQQPLVVEPGNHRIIVELGKIDLNAGQYSIVIGIKDIELGTILCRSQGVASFRVLNNILEWGYIVRQLFGYSEIIDYRLK
jgi:lipopolysaccharide transport system ATP-binding protein